MAPTSAKNDPLREKILKFSLNFEDTVKKYYDNPDNPDEIIYSETSDNTHAIEHRPHKRSTLINANLNIHKQALPSKRIRINQSLLNLTSEIYLRQFSNYQSITKRFHQDILPTIKDFTYSKQNQ
ncbi:12944_t:CDS:2 [Rhizophagus irregularis]|nr:12944_t:CDS:2 [Rhizophagus irregularis]